MPKHVIPEDQVDVAILSDLSNEYDTQRQIFDAGRSLTREIIETLVAQRYTRLVAEKAASGTCAVSGPAKMDTTQAVCQLCNRVGHRRNATKANQRQ